MQSLYDFIVPVFIKSLGGLKTVLAKAKSHGLDEAALLADRLAPDMFPFVKQVQTACDHAKGATARLAGIEPPKMEDTESTVDELLARIDKTIAFVESVSKESFEGAPERRVTLPYWKEKSMPGLDYARYYALPNFFFHVTIAYGLVRKNDVAIGKADYINGLPFDETA
ncbi:MAG TPA: DUF1993 domain-containing protein [Candidatus Paceibacterota bacterium]|nr:DUF1993 domain-containing protein [Candidatus Paceibacterota bacterium]